MSGIITPDILTSPVSQPKIIKEGWLLKRGKLFFKDYNRDIRKSYSELHITKTYSERRIAMMKILITIALVSLAVTTAIYREKRAAYDLPDGAEIIVGSIKTTFQCPSASHSGYYADVDNACKIFHVCHPVTHADGYSETLQWSFFCGNQTVFNQLTLTCAWPEEAVPCNNAPDFFYVNQNIGQEDALFLKDDDVAKANQVIQAAYGSRRTGKR